MATIIQAVRCSKGCVSPLRQPRQTRCTQCGKPHDWGKDAVSAVADDLVEKLSEELHQCGVEVEQLREAARYAITHWRKNVGKDALMRVLDRDIGEFPVM